MNIIVTGAAGALGEAVADRLCEAVSRAVNGTSLEVSNGA
jgi:nucleoside-diphosphate-sugar epimerase